MPIPKPEKNELYSDFIARSMSHVVMLREYPDERVRHNVCQRLWADYQSSDHKETYDPVKALNESSSIERRIMPPDSSEFRVDGDDKPKLKGYAAKFGKFTDLGWFREKIQSGAFDEAIEDGDVRCLKNHNPDLILGRTTSGTLNLSTNTVGLRFEDDLPDTGVGRDIREEVRRGDITGCSFAFTVAEDVWKYFEDDKPPERIIVKIGKLFDVGPVTYPAYPDTTVAARSLDAFRSIENPSEQSEEEQEEAQPKELDFNQQQEINADYRYAGRVLNRYRSAES
jgi:HK97 family phage prohead protease